MCYLTELHNLHDKIPTDTCMYKTTMRWWWPLFAVRNSKWHTHKACSIYIYSIGLYTCTTTKTVSRVFSVTKLYRNVRVIFTRSVYVVSFDCNVLATTNCVFNQYSWASKQDILTEFLYYGHSNHHAYFKLLQSTVFGTHQILYVM